MKVHTYEKAFLAVGIAVLVVCGGALVYATVVVTVASAVDYFFSFRQLIHARPSSHSRVET